ncbi:endonuclease [Mycobacterium sp.]|jgi:endonuclease III|uniref:endonuclease n=1 Tax=Mycobacterium sp. TaxID=1785 RepID=UPI002D6FDE0D|nr:endonuclease [Mycobacterium sp.]HZA09966.1 endonuclease [Mycobacterium sp.]
MSATKTKAAPGDVARQLVKLAGTTYAEQAGISLKDTPQPLFQLLILCMLASKPISADIAVAAAKELFDAGWRSPDSVLKARRADVIHAFGRAHYVRYDESSATRLVSIAGHVNHKYAGDLRRLVDVSGRDVRAAKRLLKEFNGIGDTGADIFLREVQDVWPWARPYFDDRTVKAARRLGLPAKPEELAALAPRKTAALAAALMRASLDDELPKKLMTDA